MKKGLLLLLFSFIIFNAWSQGSGNTFLFNAGSDTRIEIADHPSFDHPGNTITMEAWVYPTAYPVGDVAMIFDKHESVGSREFDLIITPTGTVRVSVYDVSSTAFINYTTTTVPLNQWTHLVHIYSYSAGKQYVYINGILDATFNIGSITLASTTIKPMIGGYWLVQSSNIMRGRFTGYIDEVRLWYTERTETEIRENMCQKLSGTEPGLVAYYPLDDKTGLLVNDASLNSNNGTLVNNPARTLSSAPIGDESTYIYTSSWNNLFLSLSSSKSSFTVDNIINTPKGFHLYRVDTLPNTLSGIPNHTDSVYYGTFGIANGTEPAYNITYNYTANKYCIQQPKLYNRDHNADQSWVDFLATENTSIHTFTKGNVNTRGEFMLGYIFGLNTVNIGTDTMVCNAINPILHITPGQGYKTYLWQDNSILDHFIVTTAGTYSVTVTAECGTGFDQIVIDFGTTPTVDLGTDQSMCSGNSVILNAGPNTNSYTWQDNSTNNTYTVTQAGTYSVVATNSCGTDSDEIIITTVSPATFGLGNDTTICQGQSLVLNPGTGFTTYTWQDNSTLDHFTVTTSGTYSVVATSSCGNAIDDINVIVEKVTIPNLITPNNDGHNDTFVVEGNLGPNANLDIYDRWGGRVFSSDHYSNNWNGKKLTEGIYFFEYVSEDCGNQKGWVQIMR